MANEAITGGGQASIAQARLARVAAHGSASHPHLAALVSATGASASRALSDAVHLRCAVPGPTPGLPHLAHGS